MGLKLIKFKFTTPIHLATERSDYIIGQSFLHSDSLYAAIMQAWSILGMQDSLDAIFRNNSKEGQLDFTLSSCFPYTTSIGKNTVFFLPRIFKPLSFSENCNQPEDRTKYRKDLKKIEWLDVELFKRFIQASIDDKENAIIKDWSHLNGKYLTEADILPRDKQGNVLAFEDFIYKDLEPKVAISRTAQESTPYYLERLYFKPNSGLYCLFEGTEKSWKAVQAAIMFLQEEGLGTDRSQGNGKFKVCLGTEKEVAPFKEMMDVNIDTDYYCNLSLYNPNTNTNMETLLGNDDAYVGYELLKRGGWITTTPYLTLRKKSLYMFKEGSVLKFDKHPKEAGATVDVRPSNITTKHPIWRAGRSFFIPVKF